jgi:hypothetical protein
MSDRNITVSTGPTFGLAGLIFVLFLGLKLGGVQPVAGWSWLWVTSPLWIGLAFTLGLVILFLLFALIVAGLKSFSR